MVQLSRKFILSLNSKIRWHSSQKYQARKINLGLKEHESYPRQEQNTAEKQNNNNNTYTQQENIIQTFNIYFFNFLF